LAEHILLVIDVGNTHTVIGCFNGRRLIADWRIPTRRDTTTDEMAVIFSSLFRLKEISFNDVGATVIASVVPSVTASLIELVKEFFDVQSLVIGPDTDTGMPVLYDNPNEIGADRIANAVAGFNLYGGPLVVVDFGTATTFDAISGRGEYLGGAIAPGVEVSSEALFRRAARLSKVDLKQPAATLGKNTACGIQAGLIVGTGGLVDRIIERIEDEMGILKRVVATGGLATLIAPECRRVTDVDLALTLTGLRIIFERNSRSDKPDKRQIEYRIRNR
jgi:type III pantothenate kinase